MREAMFATREEEGRVRCGLCRHRCLIAEGSRGVCNVRENRGGTLRTLVYGTLCAEQVDPIEKKPLFHVLPGSRSYSIATVGCNFRCRYCLNYTVSQVPPHGAIHGVQRSPDEVVRQTLASGCRSIAYTYTEPTIFFEFAYDTALRAAEEGLVNIFVTNGYLTREALSVISPVLHAANIDLKGYSERFYRDVVHARLSEVLDSIVEFRRQGVWVELTTLIIPGLNDSEEELEGIASFIVTSLGVDTPWHVTQFYPTYQLLDRPRTPVATLRRAREIGRAAGLRYVYEGNVPGEGGESTWCPSCATLLIERYGYQIRVNRIREGSCPACGAEIAGIGM